MTLKKKLDWFERKPLFGKTILVTRTSEQAGEFSKILSAYGAGPLEVPTIRTLPPANWTNPQSPVVTTVGIMQRIVQILPIVSLSKVITLCHRIIF